MFCATSCSHVFVIYSQPRQELCTGKVKISAGPAATEKFLLLDFFLFKKRMRFFIFVVLSVIFRPILAQCPPKQAAINCDCIPGVDGELDKFHVNCTGARLADVSGLFRGLGPLDLTLQNGGFSSLSSQFFTETNIGKLKLINNGIERISAGDFRGASQAFRELSISEPGLRLVDDLALNDVPSIQRVSLSESTVLERLPKLKGLANLNHVGFTNNSVRFLEASKSRYCFCGYVLVTHRKIKNR